jgi:hypothetical protein
MAKQPVTARGDLESVFFVESELGFFGAFAILEIGHVSPFCWQGIGLAAANRQCRGNGQA